MYFVIEKAKNDQFYFVIKADNHEPLCNSETYTTKQSAKNAISVIQKGAADAKIVDKTE